MASLARQPLISVVLTLAALHQLGACPCGCLEHNGWRVSAIEALGYASPPPDRTADALHGDECGHLPPLVAIVGGSWDSALGDLSQATGPAPEAGLPTATLLLAQSAAWGSTERPGGGPAPEVRASRRVLRL